MRRSEQNCEILLRPNNRASAPLNDFARPLCLCAGSDETLSYPCTGDSSCRRNIVEKFGMPMNADRLPESGTFSRIEYYV